MINFKRNLKIILISIVIFLFFLWYVHLEVGKVSPRLFNKATADTSIVLLGLTLLIGPFTRLYDRFDEVLAHRKLLGIYAFFFGLTHTLITLFVTGSLSRYFSKFNPAPVAGLLAIIIMLILYAFSFEKIIAKLARKTWWKIQYQGLRLVTLLALTHVVLLKISRWFPLKPDSLIPASLTVFVFILYVLLVRLAELLPPPIAKKLVIVFSSLLPISLLVLFLT